MKAISGSLGTIAIILVGAVVGYFLIQKWSAVQTAQAQANEQTTLYNDYLAQAGGLSSSSLSQELFVAAGVNANPTGPTTGSTGTGTTNPVTTTQ